LLQHKVKAMTSSISPSSSSSSAPAVPDGGTAREAVQPGLRGRLRGAFAWLWDPFRATASQEDRERMRDVDAEAFTAFDVLMVTDISPVSRHREQRCRCDGECG